MFTDCGAPPELLYGQVKRTELGNTMNGAKTYYECSEYGYRLHGSDLVECNIDGWSTLPKCLSKKYSTL